MARENLFEKGIALDPFKTADHSRGSMAWNTSRAILLYCNLIAHKTSLRIRARSWSSLFAIREAKPRLKWSNLTSFGCLNCFPAIVNLTSLQGSLILSSEAMRVEFVGEGPGLYGYDNGPRRRLISILDLSNERSINQTSR